MRAAGPPDPREWGPEWTDEPPTLHECPACGERAVEDASRCEACGFDTIAAGHLLIVDGELLTAGEAIRRLYVGPRLPRSPTSRSGWARGYRKTWAAERDRWRRAGTTFGPRAGAPWDSFPPSGWSSATPAAAAVLDEVDRRVIRVMVIGASPAEDELLDEWPF